MSIALPHETLTVAGTEAVSTCLRLRAEGAGRITPVMLGDPVGPGGNLVRREDQFDVAFMTFFDPNCLNRTANLFACTTCGRLEWFVDPTVPSEAAADDKAEPRECMACRETIPAGQDTCPKCGWTYKAD